MGEEVISRNSGERKERVERLTSGHKASLRLSEPSSVSSSEPSSLRLLESRSLRLLLLLLVSGLLLLLLLRESSGLSREEVRRRGLLSSWDELVDSGVGWNERAEQALVSLDGSERTSRTLLLLLLLRLEGSRLLALEELSHRSLGVVESETVVVALRGGRSVLLKA